MTLGKSNSIWGKDERRGLEVRGHGLEMARKVRSGRQAGFAGRGCAVRADGLKWGLLKNEKNVPFGAIWCHLGINIVAFPLRERASSGGATRGYGAHWHSDFPTSRTFSLTDDAVLLG